MWQKSFFQIFFSAAAALLTSWRGIRNFLLSSKKGGVVANEWGRESTVVFPLVGGGIPRGLAGPPRSCSGWSLVLLVGCRLRHGRSSGRAVFRLVQQFINLGSLPNNRQDFQHPSSSLASQTTTKEQRQHILLLLFFTLYLHINLFFLMLLSQIAPSSMPPRGSLDLGERLQT